MLNVWGIVSIAVFYVAVLLIGVLASRCEKKKARKNATATQAEVMIVAGRNLNVCLSLLSAIATAICGAFLIGISEVVCNSSRLGGLIWCLMPIGSFAGVLCGLVLAKPLRAGEYLTMIEPFQRHYGRAVGVLFAVISIFAELIWTASVLKALGVTISVVLDADTTIAVIISAAIVVFYTLMGGLYAVAYTDVVQVFTVLIGLCACVPFAMTNPHVRDIRSTAFNATTVVNSTRGWIGQLHNDDIGIYIDQILMILLGSTPWSSWIQRMLACRTPGQAQKVALISGMSYSVFAIPAILIGAVAASTDWEMTEYNRTLTEENVGQALPLVLQYLTPTAVAFIGLGAISAAVMSSADSTILAISSLFSLNIYKSVIRKKASEKEVLWVIRGGMVVSGGLATTIAIFSGSVYLLGMACADFAYILMFPQLVLVLHFAKRLSKWGCLAGVVTSVTLRFLCGEPYFMLPAIIKLPLFDEERQTQLLPVRTICMLVGLLTVIIVSAIAKCVEKKYCKKQIKQSDSDDEDDEKADVKYKEGKFQNDELETEDNEKLYNGDGVGESAAVANVDVKFA